MDCALTAVRARLGHELYEEGEIPLSPEAMFFFKKMKKTFTEAEEGYHQGHTETLHHRVVTGISETGLNPAQLKTMKLAQHAVDDLPIVTVERETGAEMATRATIGDLEIQCQENELCAEVLELNDVPAHHPHLNSAGERGTTPWIRSYRGKYEFIASLLSWV